MPNAYQLQASLPQLSVFLAVARHRSFTSAAREFGISTSAVSHAVRQLEERLDVVLLQRTTRAVTITEAGRHLVERTSAPVKQALEALASANVETGTLVANLKLSIAINTIPLVLEPVIPVFRARYPRVSLELVMSNGGLLDFVKEGFDAAMQVTEIMDKDLTRLRITGPFKFHVVGSRAYFAKHGTPRRPEDLTKHDCIGFRWPTNAAMYPWEFQRGRRTWRISVSGGIVTNSLDVCRSMAERGQGLAYVDELSVAEQLKSGRLVTVLDDYAPTEEGLFLCSPGRAQQSPALRALIEVTKEVLHRR
ncbi:MAG: LysR family transcriptional regulator [Archangium sp.]|nr:LysR family transcriptional regulator [Archangium sp.]